MQHDAPGYLDSSGPDVNIKFSVLLQIGESLVELHVVIWNLVVQQLAVCQIQRCNPYKW